MNSMEKIIERIQKLLALAGNNPNENEAAAAIEKAHAILADHNLSMQAIQEHHSSTTGDEGSERGAINTDTNFSEKQYGWLWTEVARLHFCRALQCRPNPKKRQTIYTMVGRQVNAIVAAQLAMYLCQTVRRLANDAAKKHGRADHAFKNAFIAGACARLYHRIRDMRATETKQQNALVLWTGDEDVKNQEFIDALFGKLDKTNRRPSKYNGDGYRAGAAAAEDISLNQQVGSTAETRKTIAA